MIALLGSQSTPSTLGQSRERLLIVNRDVGQHLAVNFHRRLVQAIDEPAVTEAVLAGRSVTYADLSLYYFIDGLDFAFPKAMKRASRKAPLTRALVEAVAARPNIAAYLKSDRRQDFGDGIFRHYPELDG